MLNHWTVFGGWAMPPQVLLPIFSDFDSFIDINKLMDNIIINEQLVEDWASKLLPLLFTDNSQPCYLAGWSTGAIIATALAQIIKPKALILFAPTHSFCRHESHLHGTRPSVLKAMIGEIQIKKDLVLEQFFTRCGIHSFQSTEDYSVKELQNGLFFLLQVHLSKLLPLECPVICFHGKNDLIIPIEAGRDISKAIGGTMYEIDGPHAFYQKSNQEIKSIIENIVR
jgi:surfactin synthase thioesterase subunit